MGPDNSKVTAIAPVNIALIKYWGKRDIVENLPCNSSLSITLESEGSSPYKLQTTTTITLIPESPISQLWLNGQEQKTPNRMLKLIEYLQGKFKLSSLKIETNNQFPTGAGLASSASGYAAFTKAISTLVGGLSSNEQSIIGRKGSGSACRSLHGGVVLWEVGELQDGSDSISRSIFAPDHWPDLRCMVLVLSKNEKSISSSEGMQRTVGTSQLFKHRQLTIQKNIENLIESISRRDFPTFAEIVMRDSNQFHAVCMDTYPPIMYLNENSKIVINAIHRLNKESIISAYTFDAGPNPFIFCLETDFEGVKNVIRNSLGDQITETDIIKCRVGGGASIINLE